MLTMTSYDCNHHQGWCTQADLTKSHLLYTSHFVHYTSIYTFNFYLLVRIVLLLGCATLSTCRQQNLFKNENH